MAVETGAGAGRGGIESAGGLVDPTKRGTSLFRRTELLLVRPDPSFSSLVVSQGFVEGNAGVWFSVPEPPFPGMGKWFRLGSAMILLWKSSKLIGARNSAFSGAG